MPAFVRDSGYSYVQPHAVRTIKESPSWVTGPAADDPRVHYKKISYDANGNQKEISETVGEKTFKLRNNLWDEENRLKAVDLKPDEKTMHPIAIYFYDATGERSVRYNLDRLDISSNGSEIGQASANNIMVYPNGLLMAKVTKQDANPDNRVLTYSKHYYAGSERISAKTGYYSNLGHYPLQTFLDANGMGTLSASLIRPLSNDRVNQAQGAISKIYTAFNLPQPTFAPIVESVVLKYKEDPKGNSPYYFFSDHLGSSSYIVNAAGNVSQHMEYLPFGETLAEEHLNSVNSPFKYNGKAFDGETGNYYYGARYYDPKLSIWLSVDPLAEKFAGRSSYEYCFGNPVKFVDPTGMEGDDIIIIGDKNQQLKYEDGNLYNRDGTAYTGKIDKFTRQTIEALGQIYNSSEGSEMICELQESKNEYTISKGTTNSFEAGDLNKAFANQLATDPTKKLIMTVGLLGQDLILQEDPEVQLRGTHQGQIFRRLQE